MASGTSVASASPGDNNRFASACNEISSRYPSCADWADIVALAEHIRLSAPAVVGLARALGIGCALFAPIEKLNDNPVVHTADELKHLFRRALNAQTEQELHLASWILNTNLFSLVETREWLGAEKTKAIKTLQLRWDNLAAQPGVWEQKMMVKTFYREAKTTADKLELARRIGIWDENGEPCIHRLYNLASRLRATSN